MSAELRLSNVDELDQLQLQLIQHYSPLFIEHWDTWRSLPYYEWHQEMVMIDGDATMRFMTLIVCFESLDSEDYEGVKVLSPGLDSDTDHFTVHVVGPNAIDVHDIDLP